MVSASVFQATSADAPVIQLAYGHVHRHVHSTYVDICIDVFRHVYGTLWYGTVSGSCVPRPVRPIHMCHRHVYTHGAVGDARTCVCAWPSVPLGPVAAVAYIYLITWTTYEPYM